MVVTSIREQYLNVKTSYEDAILFFRMGDFYECFDEDAKVISEELDLTLTKKNLGKGVVVPLAGIPIHACDSYLGKLVKNGHKVAICEQLSDPSASKGLVDRGVVRVVTPGTVFEDQFLDQLSNNYLVCVRKRQDQIGLAYVDISTGEFAVTCVGVNACKTELVRLDASEILVCESDAAFLKSLEGYSVKNGIDNLITVINDQDFDLSVSRQDAVSQGCLDDLSHNTDVNQVMAEAVLGLLLYLDRTHKMMFDHLQSPIVYKTDEFMILDQQTRINLEIFDNYQSSESQANLYKTLNYTKTPMGGRLLKKWLGQPLIDSTSIIRRLKAVDCLVKNITILDQIENALADISDLERITGKIKFNRANPNDLLSLQNTVNESNKLVDCLDISGYNDIRDVCTLSRITTEISNLIDSAIVSDWKGKIGDGYIIKEGFSEDLDKLRQISNNTKDVIVNLEAKEKDRTGIKNLRVRFNQVFGYFIEISKSNLDKVPDEYIRKQTLTNAERYITAELKDYELEILTSSDKIEALEKQLFSQICSQVSAFHFSLLSSSQGIARLDVICSYARMAIRNKYVMPNITESSDISISSGRHPVVEQVIGDNNYIANDLLLSDECGNLIVLTGPNMAGKSTYIRQTAIIVLMAQIGSFVPADFAEIGIVDRIFTRIGLQDDLTTGQSTFMVEMSETAEILNQATDRSLLILDEIGRGTSTYDGLAIAQSVIEYIHNSPLLSCKTLFATHYHELSQLAESLPRIQNYHVAVSETNGEIIFLRRILKGSSDKSYGIHVAKLAGMPKSVLLRAAELLESLEGQETFNSNKETDTKGSQLTFNWASEELLKRIAGIDVNNMTPMDAMNFLHKLKSEF